MEYNIRLRNMFERGRLSQSLEHTRPHWNIRHVSEELGLDACSGGQLLKTMEERDLSDFT